MKRVSRSDLNALLAAIAGTKKLYLPVADGADEKRGAKYAVWTPEAEYCPAVNTVRSARFWTAFICQNRWILTIRIAGNMALL